MTSREDGAGDGGRTPAKVVTIFAGYDLCARAHADEYETTTERRERMRKTLAMLSIVFLMALAWGLPLSAQNTNPGTGSGTGTAYADTHDDDGPDLGWLGLLGLAGLLERREPVHRDVGRTTTAPTR
jgi:MYXO-CTERM domain-containing protein